jgi:hypothetical protein
MNKTQMLLRGRVLTVKIWGGYSGDEELGRLSVLPCVGHRKVTWVRRSVGCGVCVWKEVEGDEKG